MSLPEKTKKKYHRMEQRLLVAQLFDSLADKSLLERFLVNFDDEYYLEALHWLKELESGEFELRDDFFLD